LPDPSFAALAPLGWSDRTLALFNELGNPAFLPGRVVRVESSACVVATPGPDHDLVEHTARASSLPAIGDWVACMPDPAGPLAVHDVLPRWSTLTRKDPEPGGHRVQVLAANIDLVAITAPADRLSPARVERELAVAWDSGAQPLVVLTKGDLADPDQVDELRNRLVGVDLVVTSAVTDLAGVDELRALLQPARTAVLLGPSGAGKSTLANALLGDDRLVTGAVRQGDRRGRHTTTTRQLVTVPGGGVLIDTPGLRSLGLVGGGDGDALDHVFPEIEELAAACRFRDCGHDTEPGCAVQAAVAAGELDGDRLASYRKLQRELDVEARRTDPILRQQTQAVWKARSKQMRAHYRHRPR
jgi:ribosome biogenesis GTPase